MLKEMVVSAIDFTKLDREVKEEKFREVKKLTKHRFPSAILERDIKERISNISTPMLNKYYAVMRAKLN